MTLRQQSDRTPPQIVAAAAKPREALGAFIAQELEHWGFKVHPVAEGNVLLAVMPTDDPDDKLYVHVERVG